MPSRSAAAPRRQPRAILKPSRLLHAKLQPPNPPARGIERPRLIEALKAHADRPLTLISAGAGYGKTTLAAAFARVVHRPVIWVSLMPSDLDAIVLARGLVEGIRLEVPRFGRDTARALSEARAGVRAAEMLGGTLAHELSTLRGPVRLLVLDDFQEVAASATVAALMNVLVRQLPPQVRLLITSQVTPPLPLERLRARDELFDLHAEDLRFTSEELGALARQNGLDPTAELLAALEEATAGWPTAVHVVLDRLRQGVSPADLGAEMRTSGLELQDYFSAEVYRRLPAPARELLERTAAVARFDAPLATILLERADVRPRLDELVHGGLLRSFGQGATATFEWPEFVRAFVRSEVERRDGPVGWRALEARTALALRQRGEGERALRHALDAGLDDLAAELLRPLAPRFLREGRAAALLDLLADLPEALKDLPLRLAGVDALSALARWDEAEPRYTELLEAARAAGDREIEARTLLGLGKVLNLRGRHEQVLGMSERGLARAAGLPLDVRVRLRQMKASAHFYLGQFGAAIKILDDVERMLAHTSDPELRVPTLHNRAIAYAAKGRYREASQEFRSALAQVRGSASPRAPLYLSNLAVVLLELGELTEARAAAEEGLQAALRFSNRAQEATCQQVLADAMSRLGDMDGALAMLRRADELNAELRMEVIAADLLSLRGRLFCLRGQFHRALECFEQAVARGPRAREPLFRSMMAWCELRAGRPAAARDRLLAIRPVADAGEDDDLRMRVHYWLAEAHLTLEERRMAEAELRTALPLVRELGMLDFLSVQAREEPAPLLHGLAHGIEGEVCAAGLVEAGAAVEERLLDLAATVPIASGESLMAVLGEIGGPLTQRRLPQIGRARKRLETPVRAALRHVTERARTSRPPSVDGAVRARLLLFGPPRLELEGRALAASAWRSQRALHVLVFLALQPRGASREQLLEHFWPGRQLAAGKRNFHPTLSYMRRTLPRARVPALLRDGELYRLHPEYPLTCDVWEFNTAVAEARHGERAEKRAALERAVRLADQPPLESIYTDWAEGHQRSLRDRLEEALLALGRMQQEEGEFEPALTTYRRAAELDGLRESTRVSVVECLLGLGNRAAALVEHERLRERLKRELDVDPLPETEDAIRHALERAGTAQVLRAQQIE